LLKLIDNHLDAQQEIVGSFSSQMNHRLPECGAVPMCLPASLWTESQDKSSGLVGLDAWLTIVFSTDAGYIPWGAGACRAGVRLKESTVALEA